ncbi:MAG TPA: endonuclease III [Tepidisphaeraceae bacterium]|jgi:endonuclease-3|nr:endonuclease III [Tepidisphaeraceae bacterium]
MPKAEPKKLQDRRQRLAAILPLLKKAYPEAKCSLGYKNPLQLLIATILSAQCTDERVNKVTPDLFKKYKSAKDLAAADPGQLEKEIQSTGFFRNKAKSLRGMAAAIVEKHSGQVPRTMEELTHLPGVGRKTANVVLGNAFSIAVGVVVDTHVSRVAHRLALTKHTDPVKIEQDLMQIVPIEDWTLFSHLLIHHGRQICQARKPKCTICPLLPHCPAGQKFMKTGEAR